MTGVLINPTSVKQRANRMVDVEKHESFVFLDEYFPPILDPKLSSTVFFIGIKFLIEVIVLIDKEEALTLMSECMRKK